MCVIDLYMGMYYNTIISWAVYYLMASFENPLPWTSCNNTWNTENCLLLQNRAHSPSNDSVSPAEEFLKYVFYLTTYTLEKNIPRFW